MQKYKEINGNDYVKDSRVTINETMQSIQSMNSGTAFPTTNLFEGMKCYRTDLKKTYTLTNVENNTWVEDAHASLSDEATHAAAADTATKVNAMVPSDKVGELVKAKMGDSDAFRIAVGGSANNGWVELATADDGTEPIYVRQYADTKIDGFVTPTRTATLLDGSGNTSFPGKVTAPTFSGSLNGNAETATKLATPRNITLTGNATGSVAFDGSGDVSISTTVNESNHAATATTANTATNASHADTADTATTATTATNANHASTADKATTATTVNATAPNGGAADLVFGTMAADDSARIRVGGSSDGGWLEIATADNGNEPIYVRQYIGSHLQDGAKGLMNEVVLLDGNGNTKFPHNVTAANFVGHLAGTADSATTADKASKLAAPRNITLTGNASGSVAFDGSGDISISTTVNESKHAVNADVANALNGIINREPLTNNHAIIPGAYGIDCCEFHEIGAVWNFIRTSNTGSNTVASIRSDGFHGNLVGNAGTATNADTVDGYHASDLLRTLGGNKAPVMTDIFDRAGTIDLSAMNDTDKAGHKAKINQSQNALQNLWNTSTGIVAYGGDIDMSNGYARGTLKLTQSYKDFDKILVVATNDDANKVYHKLWDAWELAYMFSHSYRFQLVFDDYNSWILYGSTITGTATNYVLSTDTVWSCNYQSAGIIAIYGIKY